MPCAFQALVGVEQVVHRRVLEGGVVQAGVAHLVRVVLQAGVGEQREAVVGRVVRQPRAALELVVRGHPDDGSVPVDQLL